MNPVQHCIWKLVLEKAKESSEEKEIDWESNSSGKTQILRNKKLCGKEKVKRKEEIIQKSWKQIKWNNYKMYKKEEVIHTTGVKKKRKNWKVYVEEEATQTTEVKKE